MKKTGIFYGSTLGHTRQIAELIRKELGEDQVDLYSIEKAGAEDIEKYDNLIFGTSTWGLGEMQEDWENFAGTFEKINLSDKKIALFGIGDQREWADSFVNGMGMLYHHLPQKENVVGFTSAEGYNFDISLAVKDNQLVGLAVDEVNQPEHTLPRVKAWVEKLKRSFH